LKNVHFDQFEYLDISHNQLTGMIPSCFQRFEDYPRVQYYISDNQISGIDEIVCSLNIYECNGILCHPKQYNTHGRQESDDDHCLPCPSAQFYGATTCENEEAISPEIMTDTPNTPEASSPTQQLPIPGMQRTPKTNPTIAPITQDQTDVEIKQDRLVLVKLYEACEGSKWYRHQNWTRTSSICDWEGIKCAKGTEYVESISLASNNLKREPPSEILMLPYLSKLVLYNNPLGSFDFSYISQAKNLTTLLLDATGLTSIAGVEKAPNLKKLNLRYNSLEGELPVELKELKSLKFLSLSNNMLEGPLPDIFEEMPNLEILLLESNRFSGELNTFKLPPNIRLVDLSDNAFSGPIEPSFLSNFPSTDHIEIDLSDNDLEGMVPPTFARFERINLLLKGNYIEGVAPELCVKALWNDGDVGAFGCDGILCPRKYWAPFGRSTKEHICDKCLSARYYGTALCEDEKSSDASRQQKLSFVTFTMMFLVPSLVTI